MIRELFHLGPLAISPFGVMMVVAFLAAWAQLRWGMRRLEIGDDEDASALLLAAGVGGIVGAKVYYAILHGDWRFLFDRSGLVWYGGALLGAVAVLWVVRRRRLNAWRTVDAGGPAAALGYGIGRIGCFLVGDDFGYPTSLPWGVKFKYGLPAPTTAEFMQREYGAEIPPGVAPEDLVAVHPTQIYETAGGIAIAVLGAWMIKRGTRPGVAGLTVFALLACERFVVEFLRAKDDRFLGQFTVAQIISLIVVAFCVALVRWRLRTSRGKESG
jgi:phosphatidylglycerol:prolipoprotein diacylglycerol transferase